VTLTFHLTFLPQKLNNKNVQWHKGCAEETKQTVSAFCSAELAQKYPAKQVGTVITLS